MFLLDWNKYALHGGVSFLASGVGGITRKSLKDFLLPPYYILFAKKQIFYAKFSRNSVQNLGIETVLPHIPSLLGRHVNEITDAVPRAVFVATYHVITVISVALSRNHPMCGRVPPQPHASNGTLE